jgi:hypothetical protein
MPRVKTLKTRRDGFLKSWKTLNDLSNSFPGVKSKVLSGDSQIVSDA